MRLNFRARLYRLIERASRRLLAPAAGRREHDLAESEARYRLLADNAIDLITRTTAGGVRTYASPASRLVLGYEPEELMGAPSRALIHPDDQAIVAESSASLRERRAALRVIQYRARHKQGHWVWVEAAQRLVADPADPDISDIVSVIRDVSQRRHLEEELRASEARATAFFEHTTAGVVLVAVRPDGSFVYEAVNPAHCAYTGFAREEYEGHTPHEVFPPEAADRIVERYRRCVKTGVAIAVEETYPFPAGLRIEQVTLTPIREPSGDVSRIIVSIHDVTEQKRAEEQLRQAQKMDAVGRLTGGLAHDFNNLLTAVIGNLEMALTRTSDQPRLARFLGGALAAAERGASLTQRLLAFARKQHLRPEPVDVGALVLGLAELLDRTLGPTIRLSIAPDPDLWAARIDPNQLELAILNLAINGRDAMPSGGTLTIDIENRTADEHAPLELPAGDYVLISVSDTGTGMSEETLRHVFDPFFTTKEVGKGSGLGLPMVQGFAAQSNGGVRIESALGEGTVVELWLPRSHERAVALPLPPLRERPADARAGQGSVLLCDDDPDVRGMAAEFLRDRGYTVHEAVGPASALSALASDAAIDVLVADYAMPEMSGAELAHEAQRLRPGIKVLIITGHADALVDEIVDLPLLMKPFKPTQLAERVAQLVGKPAMAP